MALSRTVVKKINLVKELVILKPQPSRREIIKALKERFSDINTDGSASAWITRVARSVNGKLVLRTDEEIAKGHGKTINNPQEIYDALGVKAQTKKLKKEKPRRKNRYSIAVAIPPILEFE